MHNQQVCNLAIIIAIATAVQISCLDSYVAV